MASVPRDDAELDPALERELDALLDEVTGLGGTIVPRGLWKGWTLAGVRASEHGDDFLRWCMKPERQWRTWPAWWAPIVRRYVARYCPELASVR